MQTCPGFFLQSLLESPGNLLEICSVIFVDALIIHLFDSVINLLSTESYVIVISLDFSKTFDIYNTQNYYKNAST